MMEEKGRRIQEIRKFHMNGSGWLGLGIRKFYL